MAYDPADIAILAYDIADRLESNGFGLDISQDAFEKVLPAMLDAALTAQAELDQAEEARRMTPDAATWTAAQADAAEADQPVIRTGRRARLEYWPWYTSQTTIIGAAGQDEWFWQCATTGCRIWCGTYAEASAAKRAGMDHQYLEHDRPAMLTQKREASCQH